MSALKLSGERMVLVAAALLSRAAVTLRQAGELDLAIDAAQQAGAARTSVLYRRQQEAWLEFYRSCGDCAVPSQSTDPDERLSRSIADSTARQICAIPPAPQTPSKAARSNRHSSAQTNKAKRGGKR